MSHGIRTSEFCFDPAKTERTVPEAPAEDRKKSRVGEAGKGTALSDMSRVCDNLSKIESKSRSLKILHKCEAAQLDGSANFCCRVLFGTDGQETMRKRQIRMFSGADFRTPCDFH